MPKNIFQGWSLQARVTLLTLTIFVLSIWALAFYASRVLEEEMQRRLGEQQFSTVSIMAEGINQELADRLQALKSVAESIAPDVPGDAAVVQAALVRQPVFQKLFNGGTFVTRSDGTTIASLPLSAERSGVNYMDRDFIAAALQEGKATIGRPVMGKKLQSPIFVMTVPIFDTLGQVTGALGGVTNLGMPSFLDRIADGHYGKTGGYMLVAPQHQLFVTATDKTRIMRPLPAPGANPMHDKYMAGVDGYGVATSSRGVEELSAAKSIPEAGWFVVAVLPTAEAFAPIRTMQQHMLVAMLVLTVLAGGLIWWLISWLLKRQLAPMLSAAKTLAVLSDLDELPQPLSIARDDEIGQLISGFNRLLQVLGKREDALRESGELYRAVADHGHALIWMSGLDKGCYYFNQPWLNFTGRTLEQEFGNGWAEGVHPDDFQRCLDIYVAAFDRREEFSMIYRLRRHDGEYRWILDDGTPRYDSTRTFVGFVGHCLDITERQQAERQLLEQKEHLEELVAQRTLDLSQALEAAKIADQAKDAFLANMSHELRTPLNAVIGMAGLAMDLSTEPRQRDYLEKISSSGRHLNRIINDLLDLSKIAAGYMEFESIAFSPRALIARSNSVMAHRASEKGLQLIETIDDAVPEVLLGDPLRIEQILLNLLGNAIKFTARGRVAVRVGLHAREENRICLDLEVEDTGVGIGAEDLERLFKPFAQADASVSRQFGGTGLGLAISKRLAEMMGGEISVSSRQGVGTTFCARIWLGAGSAADLPADAPADDKAPPVRYRNARVLVVDDQPLNREIAEALLTAVDIVPSLVSNGQEALDALEKAGPDAFDMVLMDIQMPVMDGLTAIRALRARAGFASLPVVAMTAHTMAHEKEIGLAAGMNDYIGKPFDNASFYRTLAKWMPAGKQASPAAQPESSPVAGNDLNSLPGIDVRGGVERFNGKEDRYRHWLADFLATAGAFPEHIRSDMASGDFKAAAQRAHSFKGRAGMLGMTDIHELAAALDQALRRGEPIDGLLAALEQSIDLICDQLARVLHTEVRATTDDHLFS